MNDFLSFKLNAILFLVAVLFVSNNIVLAQNQNSKPYFDNVLIVKLNSESKSLAENENEFKNILKQVFNENTDLVVSREFPLTKSPQKKYNDYGQQNVDLSTIYRLTYDSDEDVMKLCKSLSATGHFEYVEPLYKVELLYVPDDPMNQTDQYWLEKIKAFDAWDIHQGDTNIVIGISDTGIELAHPDLIYNIKYNFNDMPDGIDNDSDGFTDNFRGWNFGENNNDVQADVNYHGAWVGGIAGASTDNGEGVSGAGFKCKILPIKIMNSDGALENTYQSIVYAADYGCDVVNCSWGGSYYQSMAQDVVNYATINHDLLVVSAAGNTNMETKYYPSSYENVLSVGGTQTEDQKWSPDNSISAQGSSYSYYIDVCAPATNFRSTGGGGVYTLMWGGTSFASPIVAGCAGILRSYFPDYNANQIAELIKASADNIDTIPYNIPFAGKLGKGRINLYNALTMTQPPAIVFQNISCIENDGIITINGDFINYLSDAENLIITADVLSDFAEIQDPNIFTGSLLTMQTHNSTDEIVIIADVDMPYDNKLTVKLNFSDGDYQSEQVIEFNVNPGYKNIMTDNLKLSVTPEGRFGYSDENSTIGEGFVIDDAFSLFYDCGIISGTSATDLYCSVRQSTDFKTSVYPYFIEASELADYQIKSEFCDSNDIEPFGLRFVQDVYSWTGSQNQDFIIVDFQIINESIYDLNDYYFGLFADWDLVDAAVNLVDLNESENFMYCKSGTSQTMYAGVKLLSDQQVNNYALAQIDGGDGIIDITDGFLDIEKFYMISNSNEGYNGNATDVTAFTGAGPINLPAGDTATIGFAFIASESLFGIQSALEQSHIQYNELLHPQGLPNITLTDIKVFPNPVTDILNIVQVDGVDENYNVELSDISGEVVMKQECCGNSVIDLKSLSAGVYFIKIMSKDKTRIEKLVKVY